MPSKFGSVSTQSRRTLDSNQANRLTEPRYMRRYLQVSQQIRQYVHNHWFPLSTRSNSHYCCSNCEQQQQQQQQQHCSSAVVSARAPPDRWRRRPVTIYSASAHSSTPEMGCSQFSSFEQKNIFIFTARCYAERGYATVCRPSVRPSVRLSVRP